MSWLLPLRAQGASQCAWSPKSKKACQMSVAHNGVAVIHFKSMGITVYTQILRPCYSRQREHTKANKSASRME